MEILSRGERSEGLGRPQIHIPYPTSMARRKSRWYKVVKTGTENMGSSGDQQYLGRVESLDPALRGAYCKNVVVSVQSNDAVLSIAPAFTIYLSSAGASGDGGTGWSDDAVITARSTAAGGGTVSLAAYRKIFTEAFGSVSAEQLGPVHIWAEATDVTGAGVDITARFTMEAWGRFHTLHSDLA